MPNYYQHRQEGLDMQLYRAGIDIGSTTVKLVLLDEKGGIVFGKYIRHRAPVSYTHLTLPTKA